MGHRSKQSDPSLLDHLDLLVREEAPLWEAPLESTVVGTAGPAEASGPWDPEACSHVLMKWWEAGLLVLYRHDEAQNVVDLDPVETHLALTRWELWKPGVPQAYLCRSDRGEVAPWDEWLAAANG